MGEYKTTYFLATNGKDVFCYEELHENEFVSTGQPILLYFDTLEALGEELNKYY